MLGGRDPIFRPRSNLKIDQALQSRPTFMEGVQLMDSLDFVPVDAENTELPSPRQFKYTI